MSLGLVFAWVGAAWAGVPVQLPPGQPLGGWKEPLTASGFTVGGAKAGKGPAVLFVDVGDHWDMVVYDSKGKEQRVSIPPPETEQDRADAVWLARNLLGDEAPPVPEAAPVAVPVAVAPAPVVVQAPKPAPPPVVVTPAAPPPVIVQAPKPAPPPVVVQAPPATKPAAAAPAVPATAPAAAPAAKPAASTTKVTPPPSGPWLQAGLGVAVRGDSAAAADLRVSGGTAVASRYRVGAELALRPGAALEAHPDEASMREIDLGLVGAWSSGARIAPIVSATGGLSLRTLSWLDDAQRTVPVPFLGLGLGVEIPVAGSLALAPYVEGRAALRALTVQQGADGAPTSLSRVELRGGVALRYAPGSR